MTLSTNELLLRLGAATLAGLIVGLNRDLRNRPIGMRTLSLVALGSAIVVVSTIQFPGIVENSNGASRVVQGLIQGLMAGIGFIGAGVILRDANAQRVKGLTSAATVWVTAALGIACGLGAWRSVAIALVLTFFVLLGLHWIEHVMLEEDKRC
jgi:putative Mg2+ transporter-C (MgtC) family protein